MFPSTVVALSKADDLPNMKHQLDFNLLPNLTWGAILIRIDPDLESPLSLLPQTLARAQGAIRFASRTKSAEEEGLDVQESYLRAALGEYASMEDTLPRDMQQAGIQGRPYRVRDSANPLLHMMRELRNLEIHLRSSRISHSTTSVQYEEHDAPGTWQQLDLNVWWIAPITVQEFMKLDNARYYRGDDITRMLDWFNDGQKLWGVGELIRRATNACAREIVLNLRLAPGISRVGPLEGAVPSRGIIARCPVSL
jgi:hypothetical protein